jgi:predicted enzyme related to lactoylglutathione lyase
MASLNDAVAVSDRGRGGHDRVMYAKINHLAIVSENHAVLCKFYEAAFGMRTSGTTRPGRAVTVGDGYIGLNINPRREGRQARLDHFGIDVEDIDTVPGVFHVADADGILIGAAE